MRIGALVALAWAAIVSLLMCWGATLKRDPQSGNTKAEFVAARLFMFGGGLIGLLVILWQAAKILNS